MHVFRDFSRVRLAHFSEGCPSEPPLSFSIEVSSPASTVLADLLSIFLPSPDSSHLISDDQEETSP